MNSKPRTVQISHKIFGNENMDFMFMKLVFGSCFLYSDYLRQFM